MVKFFLLYFYLILIVSSILGYGFLLAQFLNKNLLKYNLGYIGILGLLALVLISYTTIFFIKHDYVHNLTVHFIGLTAFVYFLSNLKLNKNYILFHKRYTAGYTWFFQKVYKIFKFRTSFLLLVSNEELKNISTEFEIQ